MYRNRVRFLYTFMGSLYNIIVSVLINEHLFQYFEVGKREYKGRATFLNYMRICMHKLYILLYIYIILSLQLYKYNIKII